MSVPFPCAVYARERACEPFRFSHMVDRRLRWDYPATLDAEAVRGFGVRGVVHRAHEGVFLVLVGGDLAQPVSLSTLRGHRQRFLFPGSEYSRPCRYAPPGELDGDHVVLAFHAAMGVYGQRADLGWRLRGVTPVESGLVVLPTRLREADLARVGRWVREQVDKCIRDSVLVAGGACYGAASLAPRASRRREAPVGEEGGGEGPERKGDARQAGDPVGLDRVVHAVLGEPRPLLVAGQ